MMDGWVDDEWVDWWMIEEDKEANPIEDK